MKNWKDNVSFVLVEPKEPGNIGASARALKNMGFKNLSLVNPPIMTAEAQWLAHGALDILESAKIFASVRGAVQDRSIVVGTTRRIGKKRGVILPVDRGAEKAFQHARNNKIAILFGREDRGLFNEEVDECGFLMTVVASKEQPSLNLSQAVLIVAYELAMAGYRTRDRRDEMLRAETGQEGLVSHEELSALYARIARTLTLLGYIPRGDRTLEKKMMMNVRHLLGRAGLTDWELKMLHGICSQIERKITQI